MGNWVQGEFTPKNRIKYIGKYPIHYRSSWEFAVFRALDDHPNCIAWSSESVNIPYQNPLTGRWTMYVPDLMVVSVDRTGKKQADLIEIKPAKEALVERARSTRDRLVQAVNQAKWMSARLWCSKKGINFKVLTEAELFGHTKRTMRS